MVSSSKPLTKQVMLEQSLVVEDTISSAKFTGNAICQAQERLEE